MRRRRRKASPRPSIGDCAEWLRPGMVLLVSKRGLFRRVVRWVTRSPWTHAAVIDETAAGVWLVVEAVAIGVVGQRLDHYLDDARYDALLVRDAPGLGLPDREEILRAAWLDVGRGYDAVGLLGVLARRGLGLPVVSAFDDEDRYFCSELVSAAFLDGAGIALATGQPAGLVAPGDIAASPALRDVWSWEA